LSFNPTIVAIAWWTHAAISVNGAAAALVSTLRSTYKTQPLPPLQSINLSD
jgi:hypothetical protein